MYKHTPHDSEVYDESNGETRDDVAYDEHDVTSREYYSTICDTDADEYSTHARELEGEADENILKNVDSLLQESTLLYANCGVSMLETTSLILRFSLRYMLIP